MPRVRGFGDNGDESDSGSYDAAIADPEAPPTMLDSSGNTLLDQYGTPITYGTVMPSVPSSGSYGIISPPTATKSPVVPAGSTTPTGSKAGTPGASLGTTFSDIFGNLAKTVLPAAVSKYTGLTLPGGTPGIASQPIVSAGQGVTVAKASLGIGALIAIAVGAYFLLGRKK